MKNKVSPRKVSPVTTDKPAPLKPQRQKVVSAGLERLHASIALRNENDINEIVLRYDEVQPMVLTRLIQIGKEELIRQLEIEARFDGIDAVADCDDSPDVYKRRAMGFRKGKLVEVTPSGERPITLRESIQWFIKAQNAGSYSSGPYSVARWMKMLLPLVPGEKGGK